METTSLFAQWIKTVALYVDVTERRFWVTCDETMIECIYRRCLSCKNSLDKFVPSSDNHHLIKYFQWQTTPRAEKIEIAGTVQEIFENLEDQLKGFLVHRYIKRKQVEHMTKALSTCDREFILLQVDFSENASLTSQDKIQSAHWSNNQATLFTVHAWINYITS